MAASTYLMPKGHVVSLSISAASPPIHIPMRAAPPSAAAPPASRTSLAAAVQPPAASAVASPAQESAELNQLLGKYRNDLSQGQAAGTLSGLGRQIMAAAKDAGTHVNLPRAPANSGEAAAAPVATATQEAGKVNLTA